MKILFALNHPAHYYLFKYITSGLKKNGHIVDIVIKEKDILEKLVIAENVKHIKISKKKNVSSIYSIVIKGGIELFLRDLRLYRHVKKTKPDLLVGTDIAITHVGKILKIPSLVFNEDDFEINKFFCKLSYPFASYIVAPKYTSVGKYVEKKIAYDGIQKLAYLNPKYFIPDKSVLKQLQITENDTFFIIRLVSLTAGHDIESKHKGIDDNLLIKIVNLLEPKGKVFITSENILPKKYKEYQINIPLNKMHDLMYFSSLFIGDSQSMAVEAAILGTPGIRFNDFVGKISVLEVLEHKYKLTYGIKSTNTKELFNKITELLAEQNLKEIFQKRRDRLLKEKIDVTAFFTWFIENYPKSVKIMKENPNYQYKFK